MLGIKPGALPIHTKTMSESDNPPKPELMQTVLITYSNGKTGSYTGQAIFKSEESMKDVTITDLKFLPPAELPQGCSFEMFNPEDEEDLDIPKVTAVAPVEE